MKQLLVSGALVATVLTVPAQAAECTEGENYGAEKPPSKMDYVSTHLPTFHKQVTEMTKLRTSALVSKWEKWNADFENHVAVCEALAAAPVVSEGTVYVASSSGSATLASIRACESGGDYGAISSSGTYRGAYQFDYQTWASVGGSGDPAAASPAEQDMRAQMLMDARGTSPWPICQHAG